MFFFSSNSCNFTNIILSYMLCSYCLYFVIYFLIHSLEEKLSNLEDENHVLRQKSLSATPKSNRPGFAKPFLDVSSNSVICSC